MSCRTIVLGAALLASATTANADAAEPTSRSWGDYLRSWPDAVESWVDPLGLFPGGQETVPKRPEPLPFFAEAQPKGTGFVYQDPGPQMPVDYSFDEIVDSDEPWPTTGER